MIEKTIKKANDYFVSKLINLSFELTKIDKHTASVKIDDKYYFNLWIANGVEYFATHYEAKNIMNLTFTDQEKEKLFKHFNDSFKKVEREQIEATILEATEQLKALKQ